MLHTHAPFVCVVAVAVAVAMLVEVVPVAVRWGTTTWGVAHAPCGCVVERASWMFRSDDVLAGQRTPALHY